MIQAKFPLGYDSYVPHWLKDSIFYHIYPLGFFGAPSRGIDENGKTINRLEIIRNYYNHFKELGINTIQFGPLFESASHGYDTSDFFTIDHRLGTNELFRDIINELHSMGIRVVIDGVFNHVGRNFFSFKDVLANKEQSLKKNWHFIDFKNDKSYKDGFGYETWEGHEELVKLNLSNADVQNYIFDVCKYWIGEVGIDGWRLDVSYQIDVDFWKKFRMVCKSINKDAVLIGEMIHGDYTTWIGEDRLDSGTDYQVHKSIWSAIQSNNMYELKNVVNIAFNEGGRHEELFMMNFLGNHDTNRIASILPQEQLIPAFLILFTLHGYPKIYYGDELALQGKKTKNSDAGVRQPMINLTSDWPEFGHELFNNIKLFINLRKKFPVLRYGIIKMIDQSKWDPSIIIFIRQTPEQLALILINTQNDEKIVDIPLKDLNINDQKFFDVLNNNEPFVVQNNFIQSLKCYPYWGRILMLKI